MWKSATEATSVFGMPSTRAAARWLSARAYSSSWKSQRPRRARATAFLGCAAMTLRIAGRASS